MSVPRIEALLCPDSCAASAARPRLHRGPSNSCSVMCGTVASAAAPLVALAPRHRALPANFMPMGFFAWLAAAHGALHGVHLLSTDQADVATAAAAARFSLRPLFIRVVPLAVLGAVKQVGEIHPTWLAFPRQNPFGLLLALGVDFAACLVATASGLHPG